MACRSELNKQATNVTQTTLLKSVLQGFGGALLGSVMLTACNSTTSTQEISSISASEAFAQNQARVETLQSDYELIQQVSSQLNTSNIYDPQLQPVNKSEKCLLPFMVANQDDVQLYWEGECKNGYASGLGRAVRTDKGMKSYEYLMEIPAPNILHTFLMYNLTNMDAEAGFTELKLEQEQLTGHSSTIGYNINQWHNGSFNIAYRYEDTTNLVSYTKILDLLNGESSSIIAYPNYSHDLLNAHNNVLSAIDRTYRLLEGNQMVGFGYIWLKNGQVVMRDASTLQDSLVNTESVEQLDSYIDSLEQQVDEHYAVVDQEIDLGLKKIEEYRNTKCQQHRGLFRGDEVSAVCEFLGEFKDNYQRMQDAQSNHLKRIDSYKDLQHRRLEELEQHIKTLKISLNQSK